MGTEANRRAREMVTLSGIATSRGLAAGPVYLAVGGSRIAIPEYRIKAEDVGAELDRFHVACDLAVKQLEELRPSIPEGQKIPPESLIITGHLELVRDPEITRKIEKVISNDLINAEAALRRVINECRFVFERMSDSYFKERVRDVDDVERRVLRNLLGQNENVFSKLTVPSIVVADELSPSDTVSAPRSLILALVTDKGSATSHVALLARALGIPAVAGLGNVTSRVAPDSFMIVDGSVGAVTINPTRETLDEFNEQARQEKSLEAKLAKTDRGPCTLKDGRRIHIAANLQVGSDFNDFLASGAQGIGLYRTEYLWLRSNGEPGEDEQFAVYAEAVRAVSRIGGNATAVFRVLDLGGDKLRRSDLVTEANPFLGCRSIRWLLANRDVLRTQLRAILRASAIGKVAVMYPMVADVMEVREANEELAAMKSELRDEGIPFDDGLRVGVMIETPSAALNAVKLSREVDFFSIGTNDLVQYTMAADRGNESVAYLYKPTNPAVLKLVSMTASAAKDAGILCEVCGETASDPVLAAIWVALGVSGLSMSPRYVPAVRNMISQVSSADLDVLAVRLRELWDSRTGEELYDEAKKLLREKVPDFEEIEVLCTHDAI